MKSSEVEHFLPRRADHVRADHLDRGDDQRGDQRARHVAEAAEDDGDVGDQHELQAGGRVDGIDRRQQHAGRADAGDADGPGDRVDAVGVDAHERRGLPVLRRRAHDLAGVRPAHEREEPGGEGDGDREGHDLRHVERGAGDPHDDRVVVGAHEARVGGPQHERQVLERDRQPDRREDLHVVRGVDDRAHHRAVARPADGEAERQRHDERQVGIEAEQRERPEGDVHAEHEELAVGEVHDAHHAEDQREPHRDERVDAAEQERRDDQLGDDVHVRRASDGRPGRRAPRGVAGTRDARVGRPRRAAAARYFRWSQGPSGIHLARFVVNSSGHTVTSEPFCHWSM